MTTQEIIQFIDATIIRCENIQPKFKEKTSQYTLLNNRIAALFIARNLISKDKTNYSKQEVETSLEPINSIIHKTKKAQSKYEPDSKNYKRFIKMIETMEYAKQTMENFQDDRN